MNRQRVVITGLGAITPIGIGLDSFWENLILGKSGTARVSGFDPSPFPSQVAAEVDGFDPLEWIDPKVVSRTDRVTQFGLAAARMAFADAGLNSQNFDPDRAGVIVGSGIGGVNTIEEGHLGYLERGPKAIGPFFISKIIINTSACLISIALDLKGPLSAPSVACSTGTNAIGDAYRIIERGDADIMVAGGTEACITPLPYAGFCASRSMSRHNDSPETASRPFDKTRDGFVMGEGAGIVVLESLEHVRKRGG